YYWALPLAFSSVAEGLAFTMFSLSYKTLFIATTFLVGFSLSMGMMTLDKRKMKKEKPAENTAVQQ
ncbi:MAG: hypothetical protein KGH53_03625, partial [Candidatus Micrarchaeota archaeon]|nr:hypothetical protein [Candidatus Micrarchaeota archaeon]